MRTVTNKTTYNTPGRVAIEPLEPRALYSTTVAGEVDRPTVCTLTVFSTLVHAPTEVEKFTMHVEPAGAVGVVFLEQGPAGAGPPIDVAPLDSAGDAVITMPLPQFDGAVVFYANFMGGDNADNTIHYSASQSQPITVTVVNGTGTGNDTGGHTTPVDAGNLATVISKSTVPPAVISGIVINKTTTVTVKNGGGTAVGGLATVKLYASKSGAIDGSEIEIASATKSVKLKPGQSKSIAVKVRAVPSSLTDGSYTLIAVVTDPAGATTTATGSTVHVSQPVVALTGTATATIPETSVGDPIRRGQVAVNLVNTGNVAATGPVKLDVYASVDGTATRATPIASTTLKLTIKPGKTKSIRVPVKSFSLSLATAVYKAFVVVTAPDGGTSTISAAGRVVVL